MFSFRQYIELKESNFNPVASKVLELARSIRDPENKDYISDESVRELVLYTLEEIQQFVLKDLNKSTDSDESLFKIKELRRRIYKELSKVGKEHSFDLEKILHMIDPLIVDAEKIL